MKTLYVYKMSVNKKRGAGGSPGVNNMCLTTTPLCLASTKRTWSTTLLLLAGAKRRVKGGICQGKRLANRNRCCVCDVC